MQLQRTKAIDIRSFCLALVFRVDCFCPLNLHHIAGVYHGSHGSFVGIGVGNEDFTMHSEGGDGCMNVPSMPITEAVTPSTSGIAGRGCGGPASMPFTDTVQTSPSSGVAGRCCGGPASTHFTEVVESVPSSGGAGESYCNGGVDAEVKPLAKDEMSCVSKVAKDDGQSSREEADEEEHEDDFESDSEDEECISSSNSSPNPEADAKEKQHNLRDQNYGSDVGECK